jgi:hypothetical protein
MFACAPDGSGLRTPFPRPVGSGGLPTAQGDHAEKRPPKPPDSPGLSQLEGDLGPFDSSLRGALLMETEAVERF